MALKSILKNIFEGSGKEVVCLYLVGISNEKQYQS
jgi:hypothetical protein